MGALRYGGRSRAKQLSAARRKEIARTAAKARWRKPKVTEIAGRVTNG
jgi:hypothetical protein